MYQYISSIVKLSDSEGRWLDSIDLTNVVVSTLFLLYSRVIIICSNPYLTTNVAIDLASIASEFDGLTITLSEFLVQNGNKTLIALPNIPTLKPKYARYNDLFRAGYTVDLINHNSSLTTQLPNSDKDWLFITRPNTDYNLFYKSCLVNVNGYYHLTDTDGNGIYVVDGNKTAIRANQNEIGIYSFEDIGSLTMVPIKLNMLSKENLTDFYKDSVYINLGSDVSNKTVCLVLGGYFHILDNKTFTLVNNTTIKLSLANYPLLDHYFESKDILDLSSLNLSTTSKNKDQIAISELYSDSTIEKYLTLSQSFFVILDNNSISVERSPIHSTSLSNMLISYEDPIYPLIIDTGKTIPYWSVLEDGQWSITCNNSLINNYIFKTIDPIKVTSVDNARLSDTPVSIPNAHFLKVSSIII